MIKPNKILSNLDKLNETIVTENLLRQNDPNQLDKNEKPLIKIPLFKDLYNFLARYREVCVAATLQTLTINRL